MTLPSTPTTPPISMTHVERCFGLRVNRRLYTVAGERREYTERQMSPTGSQASSRREPGSSSLHPIPSKPAFLKATTYPKDHHTQATSTPTHTTNSYILTIFFLFISSRYFSPQAPREFFTSIRAHVCG